MIQSGKLNSPHLHAKVEHAEMKRAEGVSASLFSCSQKRVFRRFFKAANVQSKWSWETQYTFTEPQKNVRCCCYICDSMSKTYTYFTLTFKFQPKFSQVYILLYCCIAVIFFFSFCLHIIPCFFPTALTAFDQLSVQHLILFLPQTVYKSTKHFILIFTPIPLWLFWILFNPNDSFHGLF